MANIIETEERAFSDVRFFLENKVCHIMKVYKDTVYRDFLCHIFNLVAWVQFTVAINTFIKTKLILVILVKGKQLWWVSIKEMSNTKNLSSASIKTSMWPLLSLVSWGLSRHFSSWWGILLIMVDMFSCVVCSSTTLNWWACYRVLLTLPA